MRQRSRISVALADHAVQLLVNSVNLRLGNIKILGETFETRIKAFLDGARHTGCALFSVDIFDNLTSQIANTCFEL